jgi:CheY-like chemotaxis protein/HPt (histidine-containing phosphotransfer) domain-containing protein
MGGEAVLIVEDNALSAKLAKILFVAEGYDVRIASSAGQALALLRERRPDVVLTDLRLPDMDGFELTRRIRADPSLRGLVVLATSASRDVDEEDLEQAGCDGFIHKPIDVERVRARAAEVRGLPRSRRVGLRIENGEADPSDPDTRRSVVDAIRRATRRLGLCGSDPSLQRFLSRSAADLGDLRRAAADADIQRVGWIAHRLAGLSGMLGAVRVAGTCLDLEQLSTSDTGLEGLSCRLDRLEEELEVVRSVLGQIQREET